MRLFRGARISRQALRLRWAGIVGRGSPALPLAFVPAARGFTCGQRQSDVRRAATNIGPHQQLTLGRRVSTVVQTVPAAQKVHEGLPIPLPRPRPTRFFCKAQRGGALGEGGGGRQDMAGGECGNTHNGSCAVTCFLAPGLGHSVFNDSTLPCPASELSARAQTMGAAAVLIGMTTRERASCAAGLARGKRMRAITAARASMLAAHAHPTRRPVPRVVLLALPAASLQSARRRRAAPAVPAQTGT